MPKGRGARAPTLGLALACALVASAGELAAAVPEKGSIDGGPLSSPPWVWGEDLHSVDLQAHVVAGGLTRELGRAAPGSSRRPMCRFNLADELENAASATQTEGEAHLRLCVPPTPPAPS